MKISLKNGICLFFKCEKFNQNSNLFLLTKSCIEFYKSNEFIFGCNKVAVCSSFLFVFAIYVNILFFSLITKQNHSR